MPTYEYRCTAGHQYEKREGFSAPARQKCQVCGKQADRMIFAPPVVFKGNGFYSVDSRGSSPPSGDDSSSSASTSATPAAASDGHGHTHGPGGHSHDSTPASDSLGSAAAS